MNRISKHGFSLLHTISSWCTIYKACSTLVCMLAIIWDMNCMCTTWIEWFAWLHHLNIWRMRDALWKVHEKWFWPYECKYDLFRKIASACNRTHYMHALSLSFAIIWSLVQVAKVLALTNILTAYQLSDIWLCIYSNKVNLRKIRSCGVSITLIQFDSHNMYWYSAIKMWGLEAGFWKPWFWTFKQGGSKKQQNMHNFSMK